MGNRATVIFTDESEKEISPAVYLHWNGGANSIYSFLEEMEKRGVRTSLDYSCARFIHIVGDFFDIDSISSLSLGVVDGPKAINAEELSKVRTDHGDNGFYIICRSNGKVRRFIEHYGVDDGGVFECTLRELSEDEVKEEKDSEASPSELEGFAKLFDKIRRGKEVDRLS